MTPIGAIDVPVSAEAHVFVDGGWRHLSDVGLGAVPDDFGPVGLTSVSGRVRVASRRDQLAAHAAGMVADLEADIADGRLLRAPDIARRARELCADIATLGARDLGATYIDAIEGDA